MELDWPYFKKKSRQFDKTGFVTEASQQKFGWKEVAALAGNRVRFKKFVGALHFGEAE